MGGKKMVKTDALAVSRQTIAKIAGHDVQTMLKDWAHSAAETARAAIAQLPGPGWQRATTRRRAHGRGKLA